MTDRTTAYATKIANGEFPGKTKQQIAIESGFSKKTATTRIEQSQKFQQLLVTVCPDNLIKDKLLELINCTKPVFDSKGNLIADIPDNGNRLGTLKMLCQLRNLFPKDIAETNANNLSAWLNGIKAQQVANKLQATSQTITTEGTVINRN